MTDADARALRYAMALGTLNLARWVRDRGLAYLAERLECAAFAEARRLDAEARAALLAALDAADEIARARAAGTYAAPPRGPAN